MGENNTKATTASVSDHIAAFANEAQRSDCETLVKLLRKVTREEPRMWGPSIVGFGSYHYRYESGCEGDSCLTGFAARKSELVVYLPAAGWQSGRYDYRSWCRGPPKSSSVVIVPAAQ